MQKRVITGMVIFAAFVVLVLLSLGLSTPVLHTTVGALIFDLFVLALMYLAAFEVAKTVSAKGEKPIYPLIYTAIPLCYLAFSLLEYQTGNITFAMLAFFGAVLVAVLTGLILKATGVKGFYETVFTLVYPVTVLLFVLLLGHLPAYNVRAAAILLFFIVPPFTDTFAFAVGITVKGPKLCPSISPKKTISGAAGGLFGGILGGVLVFLLSISGWFLAFGIEPLGTNIDIVHFILIGFFASIFTQGGDLIASFIKRKAGVKDYGNLLPGHGGIMDRIDGMIFGAMLIYLYMVVFV